MASSSPITPRVAPGGSPPPFAPPAPPDHPTHRLVATARLADDVVARFLEGLLEVQPDDGLVLGDHHARGHRRSPSPLRSGCSDRTTDAATSPRVGSKETGGPAAGSGDGPEGQEVSATRRSSRSSWAASRRAI